MLERCVGICWLSSTEFLIAYAPLSGESLTVSLLRTRKEGPPCWTHFDDIIYCSEQCASPQRAFFVFLLQWNLVLCGSLRSSEVGYLIFHFLSILVNIVLVLKMLVQLNYSIYHSFI